MVNNCWYCEKELSGLTTTYRRIHRLKKYRIDITVHANCYKAFKKTRKHYRPMAPGSITQ